MSVRRGRGPLLAVALVAMASGTLRGDDVPRLKIQAVDVGWIPLPGIRIRVTPVDACPVTGDTKRSPTVRTADQEGYASFPIGDRRHFLVSSGGEWGFDKTEQCISLYREPPVDRSAYVQLRVRVTVPKE
jgi:hypothetical protein